MASQSSDDSSCLHPRLVLKATANGYLTGEYICEQCGYLLKLPSLVLKQEDTDSTGRQRP